MVNTLSQMALQEKEPNNENYLEEQRSHRSSKNILRRETLQETNTA